MPGPDAVRHDARRKLEHVAPVHIEAVHFVLAVRAGRYRGCSPSAASANPSRSRPMRACCSARRRRRRCPASTTAPAPSPNNTHVFRSGPIQHAAHRLRADHQRRVDAAGADFVGRQRPAHRQSRNRPPLRSCAPALAAPSISCTILAVLGKIYSGVDVATMIRSTSLGTPSAARRAFCAARVASRVVVSPGSAMRRSLIPVRGKSTHR